MPEVLTNNPTTLPIVAVLTIMGVIAVLMMGKKLAKFIVGAIAIALILGYLGVMKLNMDQGLAHFDFTPLKDMASEKVRVVKNDPQINLKGEWVPLKEIEVLEKAKGGKIALEYDGERFEIMDSGLDSALKVYENIVGKD